MMDSISAAELTIVDVPLGWPSRVVDFLSAHSAGAFLLPDATDRNWHRGLAMHATDLHIQQRTGA